MVSLVAVVVLVVGAIAAVVAFNVGGEEAAPAAAPPLTELPIKPGNDPAPTYGEVAAPNACALIPVDFLLSRGWVLSRNEQIFDRSPDPDDPTSQPVEQGVGGVVTGVSGCEVPFDAYGKATLNVLSPPLDGATRTESTARMAREDSDAHQENGFEVLIENDPESVADRPNGVYGHLVKGSMLVEFTLVSPDGTPRDRALDTAKQALSRITSSWDSTSKSPSVATYPQPYGKVPDPCETISAQDLMSLFGQPGSGMIEQRQWDTSPTELFSMDTGGKVEYVEDRCTQGTLEPEAEWNRPTGSIDVTVRTFPGAAKAAESLQLYASPNSEVGRAFGPATPLGTSIGDGPAHISYAFAQERVILFQTGRYLVAVTARENTALFSDEALRTRLTPIAQQLSDRLR
ncbi:hypothetical protein FHU35_15365 [Saccharopolyspora dendranthemae]|uniref:Uncharacterized protein n=1 Tax=Saccharopolyspora dendranthemae TaxID=1181886 RepID=A0A561U2C3_9PSEU|nr:hypothetical protein FHU35_15365 [Saccharopolyspora dendranthemae]